MKKLKTFIILSLLTIYSIPAISNQEIKKVFISQIAQHPALDATTKGIIKALEQEGFKQNVNLDLKLEYAQGSITLASQIASKFVSQNPDIVVAVPTTIAQTFTKYAIEDKIKLIFSSVTDPLEAKLIQSIEKPGNNTSGVSNFVDLEPQLVLFKRIQPNLKRLGIIYNPGEANSISIIKKLKELSSKFDIEIITKTASKTSEIGQSTTNLINKVDAIFISNDNTALAALQNIILIANKAKIPVYVSDTDAVELGCLAALGPNQYEVGIQTGKMIARILRGENINTTPVEFPDKTELYINLDAAKNCGISIPDSLITKASRIITR